MRPLVCILCLCLAGHLGCGDATGTGPTSDVGPASSDAALFRPNDLAHASASDLGPPLRDLAFPIDSSSSSWRCGRPGDRGDALGIGAFCLQLSDCINTRTAHICATLDDNTAHYCTMTCGGDAGTCGDTATCMPSGKLGNLCVPNTCLALDGGGA
jgi:hypothetical protein